MKKLLLSLVAAAALTVGFPEESHAAGQWYFVRVCVVPGVCGGSPPWTFGPYTSYEQCMQAQWLISQGPFGQYPYGVSGCYEQ